MWSFAQNTGPLAQGYATPEAPAERTQTLDAWLDEMAPEAPAAPAPAPATQRRAFAIFTGATINLDGRVVTVAARRLAGAAGARRVDFLLSDGTRQALAPGQMVEVISR